MWPTQDLFWETRRARISQERLDAFHARLLELLTEYWGDLNDPGPGDPDAVPARTNPGDRLIPLSDLRWLVGSGMADAADPENRTDTQEQVERLFRALGRADLTLPQQARGVRAVFELAFRPEKLRRLFVPGPDNYFGFGTDDYYVTTDFASHADAAAAALTVGASGTSRARTVVLLTPEEIDAASQRKVEFRPPGA